ncbi:fluoride efflux transporter FluC [Ruicaihuangia caeni]|uniref:Fluoride-specific ion channel FluC n=1 Tax=Ruicaihuangia caeni TaxID=3042517 RepID=A0AAW6T8I7_9MICO|nr:CrcB family protein [Klugiella sp. YN-L-19]MDI2098410.1 CrcB family protein [Klugiella sp. YN-L-19]
MVRSAIAVFVGGAIGAAGRYAIDLALPHGSGEFPLSTLLVNVLGSFALALLVGARWERMPQPARLALGPGLLGSFTTFSAVAASAIELSPPLFLGYLVVTLLAGLVAAFIGLRSGAALGHAATGKGRKP